MSDRLHEIRWPAGSIKLHGTSKTSLRRAAAEYLSKSGLMQVEAVEVGSERELEELAKK